jgi:DNA repair protein RadC
MVLLGLLRGDFIMELIREINDDYKITQPQDIKKYIEEFQNEDREYLVVLGLDTQNKVLYRDIVAIGILDGCLIHPREVYKSAIMKSAHSIIFVHNHPSGSTKPSSEDLKVKDSLKKAGDILGIKLIDSIIITAEAIESYQYSWEA